MVNWTKPQQDAIFSRGKNIIVSASAGSGKTSVMIERIAALIDEGHSLNDMLIVTFTRASANDMKDKLTRRLSGGEGAHAKAQLKQLGTADIGTLHSWCQRMVAGYFYKTDLDPDFSIMETAERNALFDESLTAVIEQEYAAADPDFLDFTEILGGRDESRLKETLDDFYKHLIIRPDFMISFGEPEAEQKLAEIFRLRQSRLLSDAESLYYDTLAAGFTRNAEAAKDLITAVKECRATAVIPRGAIFALFESLNDRLKAIKKKFEAFLNDYEIAGLAGVSLIYKKDLQNPERENSTDSQDLKRTDAENNNPTDLAKIAFANFQNYGVILKDPAAESVKTGAGTFSEKYLEVLLRMAKRLKTVFSEQKRSRAKADFNDLEHYALEILKGDAGDEIRSKYKFVFVDEYQDINPLQNEIISRLDLGHNLFLVGDLKQSIYAFRGCEPSVFKEKIRLYSDNPACQKIELNANHRSRRGILRFANDVFSRVMTDEFGGADYAKTGRFILDGEDYGGEYDKNDNKSNDNNGDNSDSKKSIKSENNEPNGGGDLNDNGRCVSICKKSIKSENNEPNGGGDLNDNGRCVSIYLYQNEKQIKTGIYNLLDDACAGENKAADIVAARIIELLQGTITAGDEIRPVCLKDIAVLVRSGSSNVFALIKKLRLLGLRAEVSDRLRLQSNPQIIALIEYLRLIDNRLDDTALINSLKSSFGGFTDGELSLVRQTKPFAESFYQAAMAYCGENFFVNNAKNNNSEKKNNIEKNNKTENTIKNNNTDEENIDPVLFKKLKEFYLKLDFYRSLSQSVSVEELVGRVVTDFKYFQQMFTDGEAAAEMLESFLNLLSDFGIGTLSEFLELSPERYVSSASAGDAVSVMTVHSSKGLEFPFVIIMDAHKGFNLSDLKEPVITFKDSAAIKNFDWQKRQVLPSAGWLYNKYRLSVRQREEEMRLLYVAVTRAKFNLDIIAEGEPDKCLTDGLRENLSAAESGCWLEWISPFSRKYLCEIAPFTVLQKSQPVFPTPDKALAAKLKESLEFKPKRCALPPKTYVTALLDSDEDALYIAGGDDDRWGRIGTLYHRAMELIDYSLDFGPGFNEINSKADCTKDYKAADFSAADFETEWQKLDSEIKAAVDKAAVKTASQTLNEYLRGYTVYKEQGFIADLDAKQIGFDEDGTVLVQGVIDVLAIKGKSALIIDFKTGAISEKHKKQLFIYSLAAEKILDVKVEKVLIYSFRRSSLFDVSELGKQ